MVEGGSAAGWLLPPSFAYPRQPCTAQGLSMHAKCSKTLHLSFHAVCACYRRRTVLGRGWSGSCGASHTPPPSPCPLPGPHKHITKWWLVGETLSESDPPPDPGVRVRMFEALFVVTAVTAAVDTGYRGRLFCRYKIAFFYLHCLSGLSSVVAHAGSTGPVTTSYARAVSSHSGHGGSSSSTFGARYPARDPRHYPGTVSHRATPSDHHRDSLSMSPQASRTSGRQASSHRGSDDRDDHAEGSGHGGGSDRTRARSVNASMRRPGAAPSTSEGSATASGIHGVADVPHRRAGGDDGGAGPVGSPSTRLSRAGTVLSTVPRLEEWSRGQQGEDAGSPEPSPQSEASPQ